MRDVLFIISGYVVYNFVENITLNNGTLFGRQHLYHEIAQLFTTDNLEIKDTFACEFQGATTRSSL